MNLKLIPLALLAVLVVSGCISEKEEYDGQDYTDFAKCLTAKGAKLYGTDWCPHCKNQKELFGSAFRYIDYIDCDQKGLACQTAEIPGYPTWIINGKKYSGTQKLEWLASFTGCELVGVPEELE